MTTFNVLFSHYLESDALRIGAGRTWTKDLSQEDRLRCPGLGALCFFAIVGISLHDAESWIKQGMPPSKNQTHSVCLRLFHRNDIYSLCHFLGRNLRHLPPLLPSSPKTTPRKADGNGISVPSSALPSHLRTLHLPSFS